MPEIVGIERDFAAIGRQAAQLMIDRLSGALTGPPQRITLASRAVMAERAGTRTAAGTPVPAGQ
jgi:DNA-binding LacI/PurR family transcriptional regulator